MTITDAQIASEVLDIIRNLQPSVDRSRAVVDELSALWNDKIPDYKRAWRLYHSLPGANSDNELRDRLRAIENLFDSLRWIFD